MHRLHATGYIQQDMYPVAVSCFTSNSSWLSRSPSRYFHRSIPSDSKSSSLPLRYSVPSGNSYLRVWSCARVCVNLFNLLMHLCNAEFTTPELHPIPSRWPLLHRAIPTALRNALPPANLILTYTLSKSLRRTHLAGQTDRHASASFCCLLRRSRFEAESHLPSSSPLEPTSN